MGIHFTDLLSAAEHQIAANRGSDSKAEMIERHRREAAELSERHAREKEKNAAEIDHARSSYQELISKIAADASATKKLVEDMVARQAALMLDAQVSLPALNITGLSTAEAPTEAAPAEAVSPAPYTGKRRGRKSNAEKAAEAAAAAAAAGGATTAPELASSEAEDGDDEVDGDEASELGNTPENADGDDDATSGVEHDGPEPAAEDADRSEEAVVPFAAVESAPLSVDLEEAPVDAVVVDTLTAPITAEADAGSKTAPQAVTATDSDALDDDGFSAPAAPLPEQAAAEEELDGFAALDALSTATPADADEEFEVPAFLRA